MPALRLLVAFMAMQVVGAIMPSLTAADRNFDEFSSHAEASAYFDANRGSSRNNVDALDGDGEGVPCESLIRHEGLRGAIESVRDGDPLAVTSLALAAAGASAGLVYRARQIRAAKPDVPKAEPLVAGIHVPPATDVEPTGILAITVQSGPPSTTSAAPQVLVRLSTGHFTRHALDEEGEFSIVDQAGAYDDSLVDSEQIQSVVVLAGDVTRITLAAVGAASRAT